MEWHFHGVCNTYCVRVLSLLTYNKRVQHVTCVCVCVCVCVCACVQLKDCLVLSADIAGVAKLFHQAAGYAQCKHERILHKNRAERFSSHAV